MKRILLLSWLLLILMLPPVKAAPDRVRGRVQDAESGEPVVGAVVAAGSAWALTDSAGLFEIRAAEGHLFTITSLGYKVLEGKLQHGGSYKLQKDVYAIREVIITATEERGHTSVSRIGEDAISHIQPSSIADLFELLPGGRALDPAFSSPQIVNLRATGSLSANYATSALGTRFLIDGKPVANNANLQSTPAYSSLGSSYVNLGTDMRNFSTEDMESVSIVRGIASVEYGDLTSGLIKIKRKQGGNELRARFKADMKSSLLYFGKGFEQKTSDGRRTLNISLNFLDSRADPRNSRQNWKRLTGSLRLGRAWSGDVFRSTLNASLDYTGSFDEQKSDRDLDAYRGQPVETYRSTYHRWVLGADYNLTVNARESFFRGLSASVSLTAERDLIDRWRYNALASDVPLSIALDPGEHDAITVPRKYEASLRVEGRPFYVYAQVVSRWTAGKHRIIAGADWNMDKNYGQGTVFDVRHPFSPSMSARPRPFSAIPANHQLSFYAEDKASFSAGIFSLEAIAGIRVQTLLGAGNHYTITGKPFADPRVNLRLNMPESAPGGYRLQWGLYGGVGRHTKFPTMAQLYPAPLYGDIVQLNYWPAEPELRRINLLVYTVDPTPYHLSVARNMKWEIGLDAGWNGFSFSIDYFREDMRSGFRSSSEYRNIPYKKYDSSAIDKSTLSGPPALENIPYNIDTLLMTYSRTSNGSRSLKRGIEFTFSTRRFPVVNTRITANGAWFLTRYSNSQAEYYRPSVVVAGNRYPYIGIYEKNEGTLYESCRTNLMFDTQIPRLGLIFSTSFQCQWWTGHQSEPNDVLPTAYLDKELKQHPFTEADLSDPLLALLKRDYTASLYEYTRIPFSMNVNLKVMKKLYHDQVSCSLFVNRLLDLTPDYYRNGVLVRRNVVPYFGMELDFKL